MGDVNPDDYRKDLDKIFLVLIIFFLVVVMLNILIAVVSEAYDSSPENREKLYWRGRFDLVSRTNELSHLLGSWILERTDNKVQEDTIKAIILERYGLDPDNEPQRRYDELVQTIDLDDASVPLTSGFETHHDARKKKQTSSPPPRAA